MKISQIFRYPVKSLGGMKIESASCLEAGIQHDRDWMLVDKEGTMLTQRNLPLLVKLASMVLGEELVIFEKADKTNQFTLSIEEIKSDHIETNIWDIHTIGNLTNSLCDEWLSDFLGQEVRLIKTNKEKPRSKTIQDLNKAIPITFSDGYPYLFLSEASLTDLNTRLKTPLEIERFRPNIVIQNTSPYQEDLMHKFKIGTSEFQMINPCKRCTVIATHQVTGALNKEPLTALARYRKSGNSVIFGMNAICSSDGQIEIGDAIELIP